MVALTLVTIFTTRSLVFEQRMNANEIRYQQAFSAAKAALDEAFAYLGEYGADQDGDGNPDTSANVSGRTSQRFPVTTSGGMTLCAEWTLSSTLSPTQVTAIGYSDDFVQSGEDCATGGGTYEEFATHTIVQTAVGMSVFGANPRQPLIARNVIGLTGNVTIINAYYNANTWSGGSNGIGMSNTAETFVDNPAESTSLPGDVTLSNYDDPACSGCGDRTVMASGRNLGNNVDVIESDPGLRNLTPDEFFINFFLEGPEFYAQTAAAAGQRNPADLDGLSGFIWVDVAAGDSYRLNGGDIGTDSNPAFVFIDGDLTTAGNVYIKGILFVAGDWDVGGDVTIEGSAIVAGSAAGTGSLALLYDPSNMGGSGGPPNGPAAPYSWRDF